MTRRGSLLRMRTLAGLGDAADATDPFANSEAPSAVDPTSYMISRLPVANYMPSEGEPFDFAAYVVIPAIGASAVVVQFTVPQGYNGMIKRIANVFVGGNFVEGSGGIKWQILIDTTGGVVAPNYDNILASLGSVSNPSDIDGIRVREGQIVTLLVDNVSIIANGQLIGGRLGGYFYPKEFEPSSASF